MIELMVNGRPYTDFINASVTSSMTSMSNDFSFTASSVSGFPPFRADDRVEALIDGVSVMTGYIEEVSGVDEDGVHNVTYSGRDRTADFIDSQCDQIPDIRGKVSLKKIIEILIDGAGQTLKVIDSFNPEPFNSAEDIVTPEPGMNMLDIAQTYAAKRQALLSSTGGGDIHIIQSSQTDSGAVLQRLVTSESNNILSQSWDIARSQQYSTYVLRGQLDPRAQDFGGGTDIATVEDQGARVTISSVRAGRQRVIIESDAYSSEQLLQRAKWSSKLSDARATTFTATVSGHQKPSGGVWIENELVQVNSDVADINRKMLIESVTYNYAEGQITTTELRCVEKGAYTIDQAINSQRPVGDQSDVFKPLG